MNKLQLTLAIVKPHAVKNPVAVKYIRHTMKNNFKIVRTMNFHMSKEIASQFYKEHFGKFFHNRLITFMSSGSLDIHIIAHTNAIAIWRNMMGPTKVYKAQFEKPDSLRGLFGLSDTRNVVHGSDSPDSAEKEIQFFFPKFSIEDWYKNEESHFRNGLVAFNEDSFQHYKLIT